MNIRAEQLNDEWDRRRLGDQRESVGFVSKPWPQIDGLYSGLSALPAFEERLRQLVAFLDQATHHVRVKCVANDEKPVLVKALSLLGCELDEIHCVASPFRHIDNPRLAHFLMTQQCCISLLTGGRIVACGNSVLHIVFRCRTHDGVLSFRFIRTDVFSLDV